MAETLAAISRLLVAFPATDMGSAGGPAIRAQAYAIALDDMPAGCVEAACRDWLRGEHVGRENTAFAPTPPQLRKMAARHLSVRQGRATALDALANAVVEREFTDEHRAEMSRRLDEIKMTIKQVANDGKHHER